MAGPLVSSETNKTTCPFFRQHGSISDFRFFWSGGEGGQGGGHISYKIIFDKTFFMEEWPSG